MGKRLLYAATGVFLALGVGAAVKPITTLELVPRGNGENVFVTFGHAFRQGDVKETVELGSGGRGLEPQVEVKRRYDDGSVKHAVITLRLPAARAGRSVPVWVGPALSDEGDPAWSRRPLPGGLDAQVRFKFPDGSERVADLKKMFKAAKGKTRPPFRTLKWLAGRHMTEYQIAGPPVGKNGTVDPDLWVIFGVRVYEGGDAARVEVVAENCWEDVPGNVPYDVNVNIAGNEVYRRDNVGYLDVEEKRMAYWLRRKNLRDLGHFARSRWRKVFWWGREMPEVLVRYDVPYLVSTGLVPKYDTNVKIDAQAVKRQADRWRNSRRDILEPGIVTTYFPMTGGREDLGPVPTWTTRYLLSQDHRLHEVCLGTGDAAGSFHIHVRDRKSGRLLTIDEHPTYSLNSRGTRERIPPRKADDRPYLIPRNTPYEVDCAHQPSLAFIPYLVTGDYYYLEEMYFWANWCMLTQNYGYRKSARGLVIPDQLRGEAWALRQLVDAAKMAPDGHPEKAYFDNKVKSNLAWYNEFVSGPSATPLGTYTVAGGDAYVRGRPPPERYLWCTLPPWQQNFLTWSLDHAVTAGYKEAVAPRDYMARLQIGMLTNPKEFDRRYAAPYFLVVGERQDRKQPFKYYSTWQELFDKTFKVVAPPKGDKKPSLSSGYGSSYSFIGRAVLIIAAREKLEGAEEALRVLDGALANRAQIYSRDPTWAFAR